MRFSKRLAYIGLLIVPKIGFACGPSFPAPAQCSAKAIEAVRDLSSSTSKELKRLAKDVSTRHDLMLPDVEAAASFMASPNTFQFVNDPAVRERLQTSTAIGLARRVDKLHWRMTSAEWERVVELWSRTLSAEAEALRHYRPERWCSAKDLAQSVTVDGGYVVLAPVYIPATLLAAPQALPLAVAGPVVGAVSIVGDIVTFVPQQMFKAGERIYAESQFKRAAKEFRHFAEAVTEIEGRYGA